MQFFWLNSNCLSCARSVVSSVSFLLSVIVKELIKLVKICQSYGQKQNDTLFIRTRCRFGFVVRVKSITLVYSVYRTYRNLVVRLVICFSTCKNNSSKVAMSIRRYWTHLVTSSVANSDKRAFVRSKWLSLSYVLFNPCCYLRQ